MLTTLFTDLKLEVSEEEPVMRHTQFEPARAFRAAKKLAANPDDLPQVFTIIESLSADTLARVAKRMGESAEGRKLLSTRPDVVERLADREALARLPEGSLGRAYLAFVERENISAAGIREAGAKGQIHRDALPAPLDWVHMRLRDTHDLWHAAVGYQGDVLGETALLGFTFAQTWNPGIALIIGIGLMKTVGAPEARRVMADGFRRGLAAAWLPGLAWEGLLDRPLTEVRALLGLGEAPVYTPIRSAELRARGLAS